MYRVPLVHESSARWCSCTKKYQWGCSLHGQYQEILRRLYPSLVLFEGGLAAALACFEPKSHSLCSCDLRAKNRLRLQPNPLQIILLMDTWKSLRTEPYKLHPPLIVILTVFPQECSVLPPYPDPVSWAWAHFSWVSLNLGAKMWDSLLLLATISPPLLVPITQNVLTVL